MEKLDKLLIKGFQLFIFLCNIWAIFIILCLIYQGVDNMLSYIK